jgi:hypothetical protein
MTDELLSVEIKAYMTKEAFEYIKSALKYNGSSSARLISYDKDIKIVWMEQKL